MWNRSQSAYLICYRGPRLIVDRYGFDVKLIVQANTSMHGSGKNVMGYIYRRAEDPSPRLGRGNGGAWEDDLDADADGGSSAEDDGGPTAPAPAPEPPCPPGGEGLPGDVPCDPLFADHWRAVRGGIAPLSEHVAIEAEASLNSGPCRRRRSRCVRYVEDRRRRSRDEEEDVATKCSRQAVVGRDLSDDAANADADAPQVPPPTNAELWRRRMEAGPRGVHCTTDRFIAHADNATVTDVEGKRYVDFAGGTGVLNTGHRHPRVMEAINEQMNKVVHSCFQVMPYEPYVELAERLNEAAAPCLKLDDGEKAKTILFTTGAEAVENAVKIARAYTGKPGVISFGGGFHGRTMMGMALTGKVVPYKHGFGPFPSDVHHARFPHEYDGVSVEDSLADVERILKMSTDAVAAVIIEPVQGEGGFKVAPPEFMRELRKFCDRNSILLIADEVQCGAARTGKFFATEHYAVDGGCRADMITKAKSIGGDMPISAVVGRADVMDAPAPGGLGGTYAGSPVACAAACAVMDVIEEEGVLERADVLGDAFKAEMGVLAAKGEYGIGEVRGLGAMVAFDFVRPGTKEPDGARAKAGVALAAERGLILLSCEMHGNTIRVLVPITVEDGVFREGMDILRGVIEDTR